MSELPPPSERYHLLAMNHRFNWRCLFGHRWRIVEQSYRVALHPWCQMNNPPGGCLSVCARCYKLVDDRGRS